MKSRIPLLLVSNGPLKKVSCQKRTWEVSVSTSTMSPCTLMPSIVEVVKSFQLLDVVSMPVFWLPLLDSWNPYTYVKSRFVFSHFVLKKNFLNYSHFFSNCHSKTAFHSSLIGEKFVRSGIKIDYLIFNQEISCKVLFPLNWIFYTFFEIFQAFDFKKCVFINSFLFSVPWSGYWWYLWCIEQKTWTCVWRTTGCWYTNVCHQGKFACKWVVWFHCWFTFQHRWTGLPTVRVWSLAGVAWRPNGKWYKTIRNRTGKSQQNLCLK